MSCFVSFVPILVIFVMRMNDQTECSPQSSNALGLTLLTHIFRTDHTNSNIVISPLSISAILTILYHGSKQSSRQELAKYLKYEHLDDNKVMNEWKHIFKNTMQTNVLIAHGLFVSQGFQMTDLFRDRITKSYAANIDSVDFGAKETIDTINAYIADKTKGKVRNFLEAVDPKSLLLLVNAVHFKGQWLRPFEPKETKLEVFNNFGTKPVKVSTMKMEKQKYNYYIDNKHNYELLGIPYSGKTLDFFIILPKNGNKESLNKLLNWLTIEKLDKQIKNATEQECDILLPKFSTDSSYKLKSKLKELGLHTIFTSKADFSNINGHKGLHVSELIHKSVIEVNEEGTEASAASGAELMLFSSLSLDSIDFHVNRPFIYFIRNRNNGIILFMGIINQLK